MKPEEFLKDVQGKISELLSQSPAKDVERNVRAVLAQGFSKLDIVTREDFDTQAQVLARTRQRLEELERRVARMEQSSGAALGQASNNTVTGSSLG